MNSIAIHNGGVLRHKLEVYCLLCFSSRILESKGVHA